MKLLPSPTALRRVLRPPQPLADGAPGESVGRGMDTVITLVVFLGIGWLLDRWLGTTPWFMIGLFLLAGAGTFVMLKVRYTATMEALEAERRSAMTANRGAESVSHDLNGHGPDATGVPTMQVSPTPGHREPAAS